MLSRFLFLVRIKVLRCRSPSYLTRCVQRLCLDCSSPFYGVSLQARQEAPLPSPYPTTLFFPDPWSFVSGLLRDLVVLVQ